MVLTLAEKPGLKLDFHIHTKYSGDSVAEPEEMVQAAEDLGLFGLCVTEHGSFEASAWVETLQHSTSVKLFRGVEVYTTWSHLQLFGVGDDFWKDWKPAANRKGRSYYDAQRICHEVTQRGGAVVVPHPYMTGYTYVMGNRAEKLEGVVAIETRSGNPRIRWEDNLQADRLADRLSVGRTGGSDAHCPRDVGKWVTYLPRPVRDVADLVGLLREGGYRAGSLEPDDRS